MNEEMTAIKEIIAAWGVSDNDKVEAVRLIIQGADCRKVTQAVGDIEVAMGALEALKFKPKK